MVLSGLPQKLQAQVAIRIVGMDRASPEVVREVEGHPAGSHHRDGDAGLR